jgi:hypothetical protein
MKDLYDRLAPLGFDENFLKAYVLPGWWQDHLAEIPSNRAYAEAIIARQLGIKPASLRDQNQRLRLRPSATLRCKRRGAVADVSVAQVLGARLALLADKCYVGNRRPLPGSASDIRAAILERGDAQAVGLTQLLRYCWDVGIPVIHLSQVPRGKKKVDGMAAQIDDRYVIVVASQKRHPAWHLFIVAHELGHLAHRHLRQGELSIDPKVDIRLADAEEQEASTFAVELLTGRPDTSFRPAGRWARAQELADGARQIGAKLRIDPGYIALSYAHSQNFWAVGQAALKELEPEGDASAPYREWYGPLETERLPEDSRYVFERLTGIE